MRSAPLLLTLSFLVATGCADDTAPRPAIPSPPSDDRGLDASVDEAQEPERDASPGSSTLDASGAAAPARGTPDAGAGCRTLVSDALIEHTCFHARGGPYRDVVATPEAVDVSRAHTAFRVVLTKGLSGYTGRVAYRARTTGSYALFASAGARLSLVDPAAPAPFSAHPTELCPELPQVAAHMLAAGVHEILVSSDQPDAMIVIESLGEGGFEDAYRVVCDEAPAPRPQGGPSGDAGIDAGAVSGSARPTAPLPARAAQPAPRTTPAASTSPAERDDATSASGTGVAVSARPNVQAAPAAQPAPRATAAPSSAPAERDDSNSVNGMPPPPAPDTTAGPVVAADETVAASEPAPVPPACRIDPILEHACLHVQHGPFAEVDLTAAGGALPAISAPHTVYVLRLGAQAGRVTFGSRLSGQHVFYLSDDLPLALRGPDGALAPSHVESAAGCAGLTRAYVFNLTPGTSYEAQLGPGGATAQVLVESIESLTFNDWDTRFEPCT